MGVREVVGQQAEVFGIGEFEVALFAEHEGDFDFGTVAKHHTAVVSGAKLRVLQGAAVGFEEHRRVKTLRSLHAAQSRTVGEAQRVPVVVDFDEGVDHGQDDIDCGVALQAGTNPLDECGAHRRAHGIVDEDVDGFRVLS